MLKSCGPLWNYNHTSQFHDRWQESDVVKPVGIDAPSWTGLSKKMRFIYLLFERYLLKYIKYDGHEILIWEKKDVRQ